MSSTIVAPGQMIAGRYRVERLLGQGGMGSVYRAVQVSLNRPVALKRLVDEHLEQPASVERFEREAHALARLVHRSTVRLFDFGTDERCCPFIVMELLHGCNLAEDIERQGPLRWDHALQVCQQILGSLAEAHGAGIIHRDIKPANIFLCVGAQSPTVKVLDFGIAGGAGQDGGARSLTLTGTVLGSAAYMSPEQAQGKPAGPATDLYALGVVLFEMLTGRVPFDAPVLTAQLLAKVLQPAPLLKDVCPGLDVPESVQALVAALLERDAAMRPSSARAVSDVIEELLAQARVSPLRRAVQVAGAVGSGVAKTEPMLVPDTVDHGWAPQRTGTVVAAPARRSRRFSPRALAALVTLGAAGALAWELRFEPTRAEPPFAELAPVSAASFTTAVAAAPRLPDDSFSELASEALLEASPTLEGSGTSAGPPVEQQRVSTGSRARPPTARKPIERRPSGAVTPAFAAPAGAVTATAVTATAAAELTPIATAALPAAASATTDATAASTENLPSAATAPAPAEGPATLEPLRPSAAAGGAATTREGEPAFAPQHGRYQTVAAVDVAEASGHITPLQRNDIIAALRQRRLDARARVARDHRQGLISLSDLKERQRVIDRELEGLERAAFVVPARQPGAQKHRLLRIGP